jgi:hypothetical protein
MPSRRDFDKSFTDGRFGKGLERSPQRQIQGGESASFNFLIGGTGKSGKEYFPSWGEDGAGWDGHLRAARIISSRLSKPRRTSSMPGPNDSRTC